MDGSGWNPSDVTILSRHTAVVRTPDGPRRQPAVPVRIAFFEDRMDQFARAQGYSTQGYPAPGGQAPKQPAPIDPGPAWAFPDAPALAVDG